MLLKGGNLYIDGRAFLPRHAEIQGREQHIKVNSKKGEFNLGML